MKAFALISNLTGGPYPALGTSEMAASLFFFSQNPFTSPQISHPKISLSSPKPTLTLFTPPPFISNNATRRLSCKALSTISLNPSNYEVSFRLVAQKTSKKYKNLSYNFPISPFSLFFLLMVLKGICDELMNN